MPDFGILELLVITIPVALLTAFGFALPRLIAEFIKAVKKYL